MNNKQILNAKMTEHDCRGMLGTDGRIMKAVLESMNIARGIHLVPAPVLSKGPVERIFDYAINPNLNKLLDDVAKKDDGTQETLDKVEAFEIQICEYRDTRMGGNNPQYMLSPRLSLEGVKKELVKHLNKQKWRGTADKPKIKASDIEIKLKRGKTWTHDFNPEIVTVTRVTLK